MTFSNRIAVAARSAEQPVSALLELTYRCNWRCSFCFNPRRSDLSPLSTEEWAALLPRLRTAGVFSIVLTGGEPLAHPGCVDIASAASRLGLMVTLFSNGSLIDARRARELATARVFVVELSIHGATPATHEALTRVPGSFDSVLAAVAHLQDACVRVKLKTTLTRLNENEIDDMRALAGELGVPFSIDPTVIPTDSGDLSPLQLTASDEALGRELSRAIEAGDLRERKRQAGSPNCGLGRSVLRIDPEGNMYPCSRWVSPIGNVREADPSTIWAQPDRRAAATIADEVNDALVASSSLALLSYCPALAVASGSRPSVPSPGQRRMDDLARQSLRRAEAR